MNVLGLHGLYDRSHDASACLVNEEAVLASVEEERFTRSKKAFDTPPHNSLDYCLSSTGTDINSIDAITYGWQGKVLGLKQVLPSQYMSELDHEIPIVQVPHHEAHAASVYYTSPFEDSAVLVIDGQGEEESTTIWQADRQDGLQKVGSFGIEKSLGYLYASVSNFCGLGSFGAGKLMGLAPYGTPRYVDILSDIYDGVKLPMQTGFDSQDAYFAYFLGELHSQGFPPIHYNLQRDPLSLKTKKVPELNQVHKDMAASVQKLLENEVLVLAREARRLTSSDYLCLAGGVAMNCVTNSAVQDSKAFKNIFVQPACEDYGVAMGSALAYLKRPVELKTPYLGPAFTDEAIGHALDSLGIRSTKVTDISRRTAELLAANKIVGWFQGGLEYGPRALGNRSILANPSDLNMKDRVNEVKQREQWRPFGPSVLAEDAPDLFDNYHSSEYMLRSFRVSQSWRDRIPAIVHVDGSTRPQTLEREDNPRYYDLIQVFKDLTGLPAVLNTSFNNHDEPIVATPYDAIKTFYSTSLAALAIGDRLIIKE